MTGAFLCFASQEEWMPRKLLNQNWMIPSVVFVTAVALQNNFPLSSEFSRNPGSMPKMFAHVLSTSGKHMAGFLVKSFGDVAGAWC